MFQIKGAKETYGGEILNISQTGALFLTGVNLENSTEIILWSISCSPVSLAPFIAVVVRQSDNSKENIRSYALHFGDLSLKFDAALRSLIKSNPKNSSYLKISVIKITVLGGLFVVLPSILVIGDVLQPTTKNFAVSLFLLLIAAERTIETFFTVKRKGTMEATEDWSISAVSFYYACMIVSSSIEALFFRRTISIPLAFLGMVMLAISFAIRWWGMHSLGSQWEIHVMGQHQWSMANNKQIIRKGPYRFIRHPIYLGVILELLSIPLTVNAFLTFIFVLLVNIPLQVLRSRLEEKQLLQLLGGDYALYAEEKLSFFPRNKSIQAMPNDRRQRKIIIDFKDRRSSRREVV